MKIKFLKAFNGDSIHIRFKDKEKYRNIIIDTGTSKTYKSKSPKGKTSYGEFKTTVDKIKENKEFIDLLILTHIDDDHVGGLISWLTNDNKSHELIKEVWFNSGKLITSHLNQKENKDLDIIFTPITSTYTSIDDGIKLSEYLLKYNITSNQIITQGVEHKRFGLKFKILSPDKKSLEKLLKEWVKKEPDLNTSSKSNDYLLSLKEHIESEDFTKKYYDGSPSNRSSIAFILTYNNKNMLFLGDSSPTIIINGLKELGYSNKDQVKAEFVKLSHHGSKRNTNNKLLEMIESNNYIISTDGSSSSHPDKLLLAKIINNNENCKIYFNYKNSNIDKIFSQKDKKDYPKFKIITLTKSLEVR